ncbi:unnamed protein product [Phaeothamnion confervicola]
MASNDENAASMPPGGRQMSMQRQHVQSGALGSRIAAAGCDDGRESFLLAGVFSGYRVACGRNTWRLGLHCQSPRHPDGTGSCGVEGGTSRAGANADGDGHDFAPAADFGPGGGGGSVVVRASAAASPSDSFAGKQRRLRPAARRPAIC